MKYFFYLTWFPSDIFTTFDNESRVVYGISRRTNKKKNIINNINNTMEQQQFMICGKGLAQLLLKVDMKIVLQKEETHT